jgi:hypothetical protein
MPEFPAGWKPATASDYSAETLKYRKNIVPNHVEANFNGDGITDNAWLLVNPSKKLYGVFVFLGRKDGKPRMIKLAEHKRETDKLYSGISPAKPGVYETICGKGYGGCQEGDKTNVESKNYGIYSFDFEGAESVYYWDEQKKDFLQDWLSD